MKKSNISYDLNLVESIYNSNNEILIRLSKNNLDQNKTAFEELIQNSINGTKTSEGDLSELMNINWIFLNSIFISLFTNFENLISKLAVIVENRISSDIEINDIKGNGYIDQYRKFMHLVGKIKTAEKNEIWDEIEIFKLVRNKLTHEGGYLNPNPKFKLEDRNEFKFLIDNKVLLAGPRGHIRIREPHFLEKFTRMTSKLCAQLKQEIEEINK